MNTAMRIEQIAADNELAVVVRGNNRMAIEQLSDDLELELSGADVNDDMVLDDIVAELAEVEVS